MRRIAALLTFLAFAHPAGAQETLPSLVVMADSSLALPMAQIVRDYAKNKQTTVALTLFSTHEENNQIAEGSTTDVLITAKTSWLETLKQQGLVDIYSEVSVANDHLVLAGPADSPLRLDIASTFPTATLLLRMGGEPMFVIANPETLPEGSVARESLRKLDALADLEPYTLYIKQRAQLNSMITDRGAYGILLASEAQRLPVSVIGRLPDSTHSPITYKAVVLAGDNMDTARGFIDYLKSTAARTVFKNYQMLLAP